MNTPTLAEVVIAGHQGSRDTVTAGLSSPDPEVRAAALSALRRLGDLDAPRLTDSFDDESQVVRRRAAELAADFPGVDLGPLLDDPDPTVAEVAAWSCGEHEVVTDEVLHRLIDLATAADDPIVRESAAAALGAIGDRRGLPAILAACRDKPAVRRRAVLALAPFLDDDIDDADVVDDAAAAHGVDATPDDPDAPDEVPGPAEARAALDAALQDRDWQVRQAAEDLVRARRGGVW